MIVPRNALNAVRRELAERVLPGITDDRARSSVVAAMGILGDLALQVREDDTWARDSLALLEPALRRWQRVARQDSRELLDVPDVPGEPAAQRRERVLATVQNVVTHLWRTQAEPELQRDIRAVLSAELELQLKRIR